MASTPLLLLLLLLLLSQWQAAANSDHHLEHRNNRDRNCYSSLAMLADDYYLTIEHHHFPTGHRRCPVLVHLAALLHFAKVMTTTLADAVALRNLCNRTTATIHRHRRPDRVATVDDALPLGDALFVRHRRQSHWIATMKKTNVSILLLLLLSRRYRRSCCCTRQPMTMTLDLKVRTTRAPT